MNINKLIEFIEWEQQDPCSSSWVSTTHKYFFLGLGKTASTRIKLSLHILEGYEVIEEPFPWLHARSESQGSFVSKLSDFSSEQAVEILTSPKWFRFCFVRNPYARLFSAYKSNIMQEMNPPSPYYTQLKNKIRTLFDYSARTNKPNGTIAFRDFVTYVEQTVEQIPDYHWSPIRWGLRPDLINYDFVGHVENFEADFKKVLRQLNVTDEIMPDLLKPVNKSSIKGLPLAAVYDWDLAKRVYALYKDDFETYDYEKNSWLFG
ncbi:MAG: sulfotransferase family protein [Crocosphaera sp.]